MIEFKEEKEPVFCTQINMNLHYFSGELLDNLQYT